jgi:hypothetical protein
VYMENIIKIEQMKSQERKINKTKGACIASR